MLPCTMKRLSMAIFGISLIALFVAPYTAPAGSFLGLDGTPGVMDHADLWERYDPFTGLMYTLGDFICHQEQDRTFILNGSEMPVCVRDVGIIIGLVLGALIVLVFERNAFLDRYSIRIGIVGLALMLADWLIQHLFILNVPFTRVITGITAGIGMTLLIFHWVDRRFYGDTGERQGQRP